MVMLCMKCLLGGAEKRYARVFEMLMAQPGAEHRLLINRSMLQLLQSAGILTQSSSALIVLDPPTTRLRWLRRVPAIGQVVDIIWYSWQCGRVIGILHPDVVHPILTGVYFILPALWLNPRVQHVMSAYTVGLGAYRDTRIGGIGIGETIKRYAFHRCKIIDALTISIRNDLVASGVDPQKIVVAPCSFTDVSLCQPAATKQKWIVYMGRLIEPKNPLLFAQAIPAVIARHPDAHCFFLGEGSLRHEIEKSVQAAGVAQNVTIQFDPQPLGTLSRSSIFVTMQKDENYPSQSVLEAMACANAIVATDVGETWRLVDKTNGMRVPLTPEAVAAALLALLNDPTLAERQQASRHRVLTEQTAERFFAYITDVYRSSTLSSASARLPRF